MTTLAADLLRSVIRSRRSIRGGFTGEPISRDDLLELVEAGVWAPSGSNMQDVRFLLVTDAAEIERIGRIRRSWPYRSAGPPAGILGHATALVAVLVDAGVAAHWSRHNGQIWRHLDAQNAAAAIQNILLLAHAKGMGACWVSALDEMDKSDCLCGGTWADVWGPYQLPDTYQIYGIVMLGHRDDPSVGEITHQGRAVSRRPASEYIWRPSA
jgi:nitroreductase